MADQDVVDLAGHVGGEAHDPAALAPGPLAVGAGQDVAARPRRPRLAARSPRIWVSSPRMTSGKPSAAAGADQAGHQPHRPAALGRPPCTSPAASSGEAGGAGRRRAPRASPAGCRSCRRPARAGRAPRPASRRRPSARAPAKSPSWTLRMPASRVALLQHPAVARRCGRRAGSWCPSRGRSARLARPSRGASPFARRGMLPKDGAGGKGFTKPAPAAISPHTHAAGREPRAVFFVPFAAEAR